MIMQESTCILHSCRPMQATCWNKRQLQSSRHHYFLPVCAHSQSFSGVIRVQHGSGYTQRRRAQLRGACQRLADLRALGSVRPGLCQGVHQASPGLTCHLVKRPQQQLLSRYGTGEIEATLKRSTIKSTACMATTALCAHSELLCHITCDLKLPSYSLSDVRTLLLALARLLPRALSFLAVMGSLCDALCFNSTSSLRGTVSTNSGACRLQTVF